MNQWRKWFGLTMMVVGAGSAWAQTPAPVLGNIEAPYAAIQSAVTVGGVLWGAGAVAYGRVGTPLILSGANFGSGGTVQFVPYKNGVLDVSSATQATVTVWTSNMLLVSVPSSATTGMIMVTVAGRASNGLPFVVTPGVYSTVSCPTGPPSTQLQITTSSLNDGVVGLPYSATLLVGGGTAPYTWLVAGGSLPTGLSLNPTTGVISGTPTVATGSNPVLVTFQVSDASAQHQSDQAMIGITVLPATITLLGRPKSPYYPQNYVAEQNYGYPITLTPTFTRGMAGTIAFSYTDWNEGPPVLIGTVPINGTTAGMTTSFPSAGTGYGCYWVTAVWSYDPSVQSTGCVMIDSVEPLVSWHPGGNSTAQITGRLITTVAGGNGDIQHSSDGLEAASDNLYIPQGLVVDSVGNIYFVDSNRYRIRKMEAAYGFITTYAGTDTSGYSGDGGQSNFAQIAASHVAIDSHDNIYIIGLGRIRKISAAIGIITTIAGTGVEGYSGDGGPASSAQLNNPSGIAVDHNGNIYISDTYNSRIRKIDASTGIITTISGTGVGGYWGDRGPAINAQLSYPSGIAVDGAGNIYVGDGGTRIRRISAASGIITTIAGGGYCPDYDSGDGGLAIDACVSASQLSLDSSGNLYFIADGKIREIDSASGIISTIAGNGDYGHTGDDGIALGAALDPYGLAIDTFDNVYISEPETNGYIRKISAVGTQTIASIEYGTSLGSQQFNATANTPGTFTYSPPAGTVLSPGLQALSVSFMPSDISDYYNYPVTQTAYIMVHTPPTKTQAVLTISSWIPSNTDGNPIATYGETIIFTVSCEPAVCTGNVTFYDNAVPIGTSSFCPGCSQAMFVTSSLSVGSHSITAATTDSALLGNISEPLMQIVKKITPTISWSPIANIHYGDVLSSIQLNATASVPGYFIYYQGNGTLLPEGTNVLSAAFIAVDPTIYDTNIKVSNIIYVEPTISQNILYQYYVTYDDAGNVRSYTDFANESWNMTGGYDGLNRLRAANGPGHSMSWSYDSFGNRTSWTDVNGQSQTTTYNANNHDQGLINRISSAYDAAGNIINDGQNQYLYDAENRICAVMFPTGINGIMGYKGYVYDAEGYRVAKGKINSLACGFDPTNPSQFQEESGYQIGPNGEELAETDGQGNSVKTDVYANGELIATYDAQMNLSFHLNDWLGTRRVTVDYDGSNPAYYPSLPFGEQTGGMGTGVTNLFFTGQPRDQETGNDLLGVRFYNSASGRLLSPDPLGGHLEDPQTLNRYAYAHNNPLTLSDPTGLDFYLNCTSTDHSNCTQVQLDPQNSKSTHWVQTGSDGQAKIITSDSIRDGINKASMDQNGLVINYTNQGVYFDNPASHTTDANGNDVNHNSLDIAGSGDLKGFNFHVDGNCGGTCLSAGEWSAPGMTSAQAREALGANSFNIPFENLRAGLGYGDHPYSSQYRFGGSTLGCAFGACPNTPHLSVPFDTPKATVPASGGWHVDAHSGWSAHNQDINDTH